MPADPHIDLPQQTLSGVPVLVVEDDLSSAKLMSLVLRQAGCDLRLAVSAEEALDILHSFFPRAIILDLVLPRMSGLLLAERLKETPQHRDVVIIAVSAVNGGEAERIAQEAGCTAYVRKPIDPISFANLVLEHLRGER